VNQTIALARIATPRSSISKLPPCVGALLMFNHMLLVTDWTSAVILLRNTIRCAMPAKHLVQKVNAGHRGWYVQL
jgi:hypothetical protein